MGLKGASLSRAQGWHEVTVENLKAPTENALATGPFGSSIGSRFFEAHGVPVIRGCNLSTDGSTQFIDDGFVFVSEAKATEFRRSVVTKGDLVFTCWGTINQVGLIGEQTEYERYIISNKQMKFTPDENKADSLFLFYLFSGPALQRTIINQSIGSSVPGFNLGQLRAMRLRVPALPEQRAIARTLSDVDALIGALDKLIAKKRDIKQAAMQQILTGKQRLPGFSGEWELLKFADVADKDIQWSITGGPFGSNLKASAYVSEGVRIIQLQNIGQGVFNNDYAIFTTAQKADELLSCNIYPGEIILSKMGDPVARACFVPEIDSRYLMASDGIRLAVNKKRFDKRFVHEYINSIYFRRRATEASTGSTRQRLGIDDLKRLPVIAPPLPEQAAIAAVLSDMDAEIAALEQRRDKTRALKQGMMQELLTGKTRLI
jgi:type I restriction enzyme S subunit